MLSADYPFRAILQKQAVRVAVSDYLAHLEYDNFKSSIDDEDYHDTCLSVWKTMQMYGEQYHLEASKCV